MFNTGAPLEIVLEGRREPVSLSFPPLSPGLNLLSLFDPEDIHALEREGDQVYRFVDDKYLVYNYLLGTWDSAPVPPVRLGEGFFYQRGPGGGCREGLIYFNNYVPASGLYQRIFDPCQQAGLEDPAWKMQLLLLTTNAVPMPVGRPLSFQTGLQAGHLDVSGGAVFCLPGTLPGQPASFLVRLWRGDSYEQAVSAKSGYGQSAPFTVTLGGSIFPPANLTGFVAPRIQTPGSCLKARPNTNTGGVNVSFIADPSFRYALEASPDLKTWTRLKDVENFEGLVIVEHAPNGTAQNSFYRLTAWQLASEQP